MNDLLGVAKMRLQNLIRSHLVLVIVIMSVFVFAEPASSQSIAQPLRTNIASAVTVLMNAMVEPSNPGKIKRDYDWPWTYKALDLCKMPVYMDVGHYVELEDCDKKEIVLVQVDCEEIGKGSGDFPCYTDCEKIKVRANFPAVFGANLDKGAGEVALLTDTSVYWTGDVNTIPGDGEWYELEICIDAWKTELWKSGSPGDKIKVGELTITVKPRDDE